MGMYIGARYVPIFYENSEDPTSSLWENNVTYEPLTWVTLANGHMYISKKEVPASIGTPADNGEYWLEAGQYNAYIQTLQDEIDDMKDGTISGSLQNQITQNATDISDMKDGSVEGSLQDQINTNSGDISDMKDGSVEGSLQDQINDNTTDITTNRRNIEILSGDTAQAIARLSSRINKKQNNDKERVYLFLGDSYYLGGQGTSYTGIGWATQVINFLGLDSSHYILTPATDITQGGAVTLPGFYPSEAGHLSFKSILENCASHLTEDEKSSVTDIVVAGGYNDRTKANLITTGIAQFSTYAKSTFPNAKLWCAHIGWCTNLTGRNQLLATQQYYRGCVRYGMSYIDNAELVLTQDSLFISDGVHPTQAGYKIIGQEIANTLVGGTNSFIPAALVVNAAIVINENVTSASGYFYVIQDRYGEKTITFAAPLIFHLNTGYLINTTTPLQFEITCDAIQVTDSNATSKDCMIQIAGGTVSGFRLVPAVIKFVEVGSSKRIRIDFKEDTGLSASIIGIPQMSFTIPSSYL